jgi:hypothetical protein
MTLDQPLPNLAAPSDNAAPRADLWRNILLPFIATRLALVIIGCLAAHWLLPADQVRPGWIELLSRFDGLWYLRIARDGYFFDPTRQSSIAFAPLLPMLMRMIGSALGSSDLALLLAGAAIANAALLIGLVFVHAMTRDLFGEKVARRAVWYVLICPGTLYLSAVYPMSLMLAIAAASIWYARQNRWRMAATIGMLAPLARPDGVLLFIPLVLEAARSRRIDRRYHWLCMIPAMLGIWLIAQWIAFGTPLAFAEAQKMWEPSPFITVFHSPRAGLILGMAAFFTLLTVAGGFTLPLSCSAHASLFLAMMLFAGRLWSLPRFVVILFPCFITLAWAGKRWRWVHVFYVVSATLIAILFTVRFSLGLWVA